jgi:hypothetical protein
MIRYCAHRLRDQRDIVGLQQQRFRIQCLLDDAVLLLVEWVSGRTEARALPTTRVAHDPEEPGARVSARECVEVSQRAQRRLLHGVLGIVFIPHEPPRQPMGSCQMGENDFIESVTDRG